jgi:hypothetical protein
MVEGWKGTNKSTMLLDLAARASIDGIMPRSGNRRRRPVNSVFFVGEDPLEETFVQRCAAACGDTSRIFAYGPGLKIPKDWSQMAQIIRSHKARFVVLDPAASFMRSMYHGVREALEPVYQFAQQEKVAVVLSRHLLYKGQGRTARERGVGSFDFTNLCRSTLLLAPHPENADDRVLLHTDSNLDHLDLAIGFRLDEWRPPILDARKGYVVQSKNTTISIGEWFDCGKNYKEQDVLGARPVSKRDLTIEWLGNLLRQGPKFAHEVKAAAQAQGFSQRTLETAKQILRVRSQRRPWPGPGPGSSSEWVLP